MKTYPKKIFKKVLNDYKNNVKKDPYYGEVEHPVNTFHETITKWLEPLGYVPVFDNHPCTKPREFHFAKEGIRVICVDQINFDHAHCYLHADILLNPYPLALKTCKYDIGTWELKELHKLMLKNIKKIKK